jgi:UPF0716 protein FxsA
LFSRLLLLFILLPFVEMTLLVILGQVTAWWVPIVFIIGTGFLGAWLARTQGMAVYRRIQSELSAGRMPTDAMIDGAMVFVAGLLLVSPGVLTDVLGISAMLPPIRRIYRQQLVAWFHRTFKVSSIVAGESVSRSSVVDSYVVEKDRLDPPTQ